MAIPIDDLRKKDAVGAFQGRLFLLLLAIMRHIGGAAGGFSGPVKNIFFFAIIYLFYSLFGVFVSMRLFFLRLKDTSFAKNASFVFVILAILQSVFLLSYYNFNSKEIHR